jgi:hypothetical protein
LNIALVNKQITAQVNFMRVDKQRFLNQRLNDHDTILGRPGEVLAWTYNLDSSAAFAKCRLGNARNLPPGEFGEDASQFGLRGYVGFRPGY